MVTEAALLTLLLMTSAGESSVTNGALNGQPRIVQAAPRFVLVPGTPVQYARGVDATVFAYGGRYYAFHDGAWLSSASYRGPWVLFTPDRVPPAVRAVPATFYRIPPGPMKTPGTNGKPTGGW